MASLTEVLRLLPDNKKQAARSWAAYSLLWLPLAASAANIKASVTTQDDSDFIVMRIKAYATDNAAPPVELTAPQATITFTSGSTNLFPDGNAVHVADFAVSAGARMGHELEFPQLVARNTTLTALASNLTATAMNLRLVLFGLRVFSYVGGAGSL